MSKVNRSASLQCRAQGHARRLFMLYSVCVIAPLLFVVGATHAYAADVIIAAEYLAGTHKGGGNGFRNVTRPATLCAADSGGCMELTTVDIPVGEVNYGALSAGAVGQDAVYFHGPAHPVRIELKDERTHRAAPVTFRVTGVIGQYVLHADLKQLSGAPVGNAEAAHAALWEGGSWQTAPAGCATLPMQPMATESAYRFGWRLPHDGSSCFKAPRRSLPAGALVLGALGVAYELVTPDPAALPNGTYRAVQTFTVGPGQDFDFGNQAHPARSSIDIEFVLKVRHQFMVTEAGADSNVELAPTRGWLNWFAEGKPATRIDHDVAFGLTTGEPLRISLRCEDGQDAAGQCMIRNANNAAVPVGVSLTVVGAYTDSNTPFSRIPLTTQVPVALDVDRYLDNAAATAHLSVDGKDVEEMGRHPGTTYAGRVSIVFDAIPE